MVTFAVRLDVNCYMPTDIAFRGLNQLRRLDRRRLLLDKTLTVVLQMYYYWTRHAIFLLCLFLSYKKVKYKHAVLGCTKYCLFSI